jgi:RES domain-containing protein
MVLAVPSAVVPREWNYLLNPEHEKFSQVVKRVENLPFLVDARLWRK